MEPTVHINLGYLVLIFSLIGTLFAALIWIINFILKQSSEKQAVNSTLVAMQKEIDQLKTDKVSKIEIVTFNSKLDNVVEGLKNLTELIINLNNKNHPK